MLLCALLVEQFKEYHTRIWTPPTIPESGIKNQQDLNSQLNNEGLETLIIETAFLTAPHSSSLISSHVALQG